MSVTATRAEPAPRIWLLVWLLVGLVACSRKQEEARSAPEHPGAAGSDPFAALPSPDPDPAIPPPEATGPAGDAVATVEETVNQVPRSGSGRPVPAGRPAFLEPPPATAWPGRPWVFRPARADKRPIAVRLAAGPEGMSVSGATVRWIPSHPGRFRVSLEAGADSSRERLDFFVDVRPVLALVLKPLPERADKGDTVAFDLGGSAFPRWAEDSLTVRFDYEGDGKWDTEALPLAANLRHRHAYPAAGRFAPKVEGRHGNREAGAAEGRIEIVGSVQARFALAPDTVEPGGAVSVDASGSRGDGRLVYRLDLDGDGKTDWSDSAKGRATLKAPASGRYQAALVVRDPMGQEGTAAALLLVNARPKAALRIRNARENMSAPVEVLLEGADGDDSLRSLRINFTGSPDAWESAAKPDSAKGPGRWRKTFRHAYGKTGKYAVEGCAASADGRETCGKAEVEIFNAPPSVEPGAEVKATVGVPAEIVGVARDPDGSIVKWEWDLDGDGRYDVASRKDGKVRYTFARKGTFTLGLRVTTADGMTATAARRVEVRKP